MCDTFVNISGTKENPRIIFGKNSDREPNECQILEYHPPKENIQDPTVKCTYIEIPQVKETHGILISRPFWMWGAEIGVNDAGVVIGNEAVFTRLKMTLEKKLLGMDILRLALERSETAEKALVTIVNLIHDYGQGGPCGFEDKKLSYHNSFMIADKKEAWVLETAGPYWAAKRVDKFYAISNGLTIDGKYDIAHPDMVGYAIKNGWLKKGYDFSFRQTYSDWFYTTFSRCTIRRKQTEKKIRISESSFDVLSAFEILRNHNHNPNYSPSGHPLMNTVCAHAGIPVSRHAAQSTGSMVVENHNGKTTIWVTGTSAPCLSLFKPLWFEAMEALPDHSIDAGGVYKPGSIWWQHELIHRKVLPVYNELGPVITKELTEIEGRINIKIKESKTGDEADITRLAFDREEVFKSKYVNILESISAKDPQNFIYRNYWSNQNEKAGLRSDHGAL